MREQWAAGYTQDELDDAQSRYGLRFPSDLVALYLERRPVAGYDWRTDEAEIRSALKWPLEGVLFDVENDDLWWPEWGEKPPTKNERADIVGNVIASAPPLIPIIGHRYIPAEPQEAGNPVFSIYQSDVIIYGANLAEYFDNEFEKSSEISESKFIPFWSELVARNR